MSFGCSNGDDSLVGIQWKLKGILNVETGELIVLKSHRETDCDRCYTLRFETDSTGFGYSCANGLHFNINGFVNSSDRTDYIGVMTDVLDPPGDCSLFIEVLPMIDDCFFCDYQLIFAYMQDKIRYHLVYKKL